MRAVCVLCWPWGVCDAGCVCAGGGGCVRVCACLCPVVLPVLLRGCAVPWPCAMGRCAVQEAGGAQGARRGACVRASPVCVDTTCVGPVPGGQPVCGLCVRACPPCLRCAVPCAALCCAAGVCAAASRTAVRCAGCAADGVPSVGGALCARCSARTSSPTSLCFGLPLCKQGISKSYITRWGVWLGRHICQKITQVSQGELTEAGNLR